MYTLYRWFWPSLHKYIHVRMFFTALCEQIFGRSLLDVCAQFLRLLYIINYIKGDPTYLIIYKASICEVCKMTLSYNNEG
jgi:hypothetical protein